MSLEGKLRFIPLQKLSGKRIAALTEAVLASAEENPSDYPAIAFFEWEPTITLAYPQSFEDIDAGAAGKHGFDIVRMIGGGRAYFHDGDISFMIVLPKTKAFGPQYEIVAGKFAEAFRTLGITDAEARYREGAGADGYDVFAGSKILFSFAQQQKGNHVMIHGAFYPEKPDFHMAAKLARGYDGKDAEAMEKKVGYLSEFVSVDREKLLSVLMNAFNGQNGGFTEKELALADRLFKEKYADESYHSGGSQKRGLCWLPKKGATPPLGAFLGESPDINT